MTTPPDIVQCVCECVVILKGLKEVSWKSVRTMMNDPNFLVSLQKLNCDDVSQKQVGMIKAHLKVWIIKYM